MGTGTAVSTGDIITAAKMNLKQEDFTSISSLTLLDNNGAGTNQVTIRINETETAAKTLSLKINNASLTMDLGGNLTTAAAFVTSGAFALTLTVSNTTNATIPAGTITLCDLSTAQAIAGAKTFGATALKINNPAGTFAYGISAGAILAARTLSLPVLGGDDTICCVDANQTLTTKTLTSPTINGGTATALTGLAIRSTGTGAFDLTFANSENLTAGKTLTIKVNNADRTVDISGNLTLAGTLTTAATFTTAGAFALTLTATGITNVTLPTSGTLAVLGANTFTGDQTLDGNVDTILHVTTSPIIDIGADIFATGTFIDIAYDTAQTLSGALIGININLNTLITLSNQNINGIIIAMPATYGNGTEVGLQITGDGQTINIGNDADLYISLAKASSVDINIQGISPVIDIGADVLEAGYIISIDYDTAETTSGDLYILDVFRAAFNLTLGADLYGINLDFNTRVVAAADRDVIGYRLTTPALTSVAPGVTTIYTGFSLPTAGALVANNGTTTLNWYGINIQMPNITQTLGTMLAVGIQLTEGTTTSGTINAININGSVDTIINFSVSPIIDIGADIFATGTFIDIAYDTAQALTGALTGINIDLGTNVTTAGAGAYPVKGLHIDLGPLAFNAGFNNTVYGIHLECDPTLTDENITGILVTMSATFATGAEIGLQVTGDGQTINICNDADLYVSLAKANSVDINIQGVTPVIDIGADVFSTGTVFDFAYDTAEVATAGGLIGVSINMNTNLTPLAGQNVTSYTTQTAAFSSVAAAATIITGYQLPTAGALVMNNAGGSITWYGLNIQAPDITQTAGAMVAIGIQLTEGTTTSGTINAININGTGVDTIINFSASPLIDIGADVFSTGYFMDIAFDTIETLTAQLTGIRIDWDTVVVTTGGAGTGNITPFWADLGNLSVNAAYNATIYGIRLDLDFVVGGAETIRGASIVMPAVFGAGTETGIYVTGDSQIISICNDADLYISLAKANSVDILIQGISPVVDIGADVLPAGYFLSVDYDTVETTTGDLYIIDVFRAANALTLGADLYGINLDFNTNVVAAADRDVRGYRVTMPALTSAGAVATNFYGFTLSVAGALVMNNGGGSLNFYGLNIGMPNITQTAGTMLAVGVQLTEGVTTSGTCNAININGDVDTIVNFSASPIIDIGADIFSAGTFIDIAYDTAETATAAIIGASINLNTNVTPLGGQNITGYTTQTAAFSSVAAAATVLTGYQLPTAGALVMNNGGGSITWYGLDIQVPNITQTAGTMTASGIRITEGVTTSGTATGIAINVTRAISFTKASDLVMAANTATSLDITDGTTTYVSIDTRTATDNITAFAFDASDPTFASANGTTWRLVTLNAFTLNLTGGVQVTALDGLSLYITAPIVAAGQATTAVTVSTVYIASIGLGANMAFTNNYVINTAAGAYLTAAGVWTDKPSALAVKKNVKTWDFKELPDLLKQIRPVKFQYDPKKFKDIAVSDEKRYGIVAEELPQWLRAPGDHQTHGVSGSVLATFELAAIKYLEEENGHLKERLTELEAQLAR